MVGKTAYIDPTRNRDGTCFAHLDDSLVYFDCSHVSAAGSIKIGQALKKTAFAASFSRLEKDEDFGPRDLPWNRQPPDWLGANNTAQVLHRHLLNSWRPDPTDNPLVFVDRSTRSYGTIGSHVLPDAAQLLPAGATHSLRLLQARVQEQPADSAAR